MRLQLIAWIVLSLSAQAQTQLPETILQSVQTGDSTLSTNSVLRLSFLTLDEALALQPGARLFRRLDASAAHPTTQGMSLRNTGANAAGRTLVLQDGIPMNDPFGGWLPWTRWSPLGLGRIETTREGGVSREGWTNLGGVLRLDRSVANQAVIRSGSFIDYDAGLYASQPLKEQSTLRAALRRADVPGYYLLPKSKRGPVDRRSGFTIDTLSLGAETQHGPSRLRFDFDGYAEERQNGSQASRNASEGFDAHLRLDTEQTRWSMYYQDRRFENVFTRISDDRSSERPVLDQYRVPAEAWGLVQRTRFERNRHAIQWGADARWLQGETNERFRDLGQGFTRERSAGGEQLLAGLVVMDHWQGDQWKFDGKLRLDVYRNENGRETIQDRETNRLLTSTDFQTREYQEPALNLAATRRLKQVHWRSAAFTGTRLPSLNEFYRPFRVGNDITIANEALRPERIYGAETGLRWQADAGQISCSVFYNRIEDLVANVSLVEGPGNVAPWGFIPAGGTGRQRQNIDRAHTAGLEVEGSYQLSKVTRLECAYLFTDSEVDAHERLEGKSLAQTPEHSGSLLAWWDLHAQAQAGVMVRAFSSVFEDDLNERSLDAAVTADLLLRWQAKPDLQVALRLNNLFDESVEVRKDGSGRIFTGAPRGISGTLQLHW